MNKSLFVCLAIFAGMTSCRNKTPEIQEELSAEIPINEEEIEKAVEQITTDNYYAGVTAAVNDQALPSPNEVEASSKTSASFINPFPLLATVAAVIVGAVVVKKMSQKWFKSKEIADEIADASKSLSKTGDLPEEVGAATSKIVKREPVGPETVSQLTTTRTLEGTDISVKPQSAVSAIEEGAAAFQKAPTQKLSEAEKVVDEALENGTPVSMKKLQTALGDNSAQSKLMAAQEKLLSEVKTPEGADKILRNYESRVKKASDRLKTYLVKKMGMNQQDLIALVNPKVADTVKARQAFGSLIASETVDALTASPDKLPQMLEAMTAPKTSNPFVFAFTGVAPKDLNSVPEEIVKKLGTYRSELQKAAGNPEAIRAILTKMKAEMVPPKMFAPARAYGKSIMQLASYKKLGGDLKKDPKKMLEALYWQESQKLASYYQTMIQMLRNPGVKELPSQKLAQSAVVVNNTIEASAESVASSSKNLSQLYNEGVKSLPPSATSGSTKALPPAGGTSGSAPALPPAGGTSGSAPALPPAGGTSGSAPALPPAK